MNKKYAGEVAGSYFRTRLERQYKVCNFGLKEIPASHSSKHVSSPVCSPAVALINKKGFQPLKKDMCEISLNVFLLPPNDAIEE